MQTLLGVFSAFGLSASAGVNAYIPLLVVGAIAHYLPNTLHLSKPWDLLANPWILIFMSVLVIIETLADKFPAVNHINDIIQTFIRPAAGAIAFAASAKVITDVHPLIALACGLLIAGGVHVTKSAVVRPVVSATTAGAGNTPVSIAEDVAATAVSLLSIFIPILVGVLVVMAVVILLWWFSRRKQQTA
jgi:hypothetical protein